MKVYDTSDIRNVVLCGHGSAGTLRMRPREGVLKQREAGGRVRILAISPLILPQWQNRGKFPQTPQPPQPRRQPALQ